MPDYEKILIKSVSVLMDGHAHFETKDLLLTRAEKGYTITAIEPKIETEGAKTVDGYGLTAMPSFVDLFCRMGEPGGDKQESFSTGTNAAVNGGYGTVAVLPFGKPATDDPSVLESRSLAAEQNGRCKVLFAAALSVGCAGKKLCDHAALKNAGAVAFTDGMYECLPDDLLREAMENIARIDGLLIASPRLQRCYADGSVNLGRVSRLLGLKGIPYSAEVADIARYLVYAAETGCRLHIAGVSTLQGIEALYIAKKHGIDVTASAFPYSFSFSEDDILFYGSMAKVWPPLRSLADVAGVRQALIDGTIDCVSSVHTPCKDTEKTLDISASSFGSTGLQTAFSAACTYLYPGEKVDAARLRELFSSAPAKILGIEEKKMSPGSPASFSLIDFDRDFIVSENLLKSRTGNSIYKGLTLRGSVERIFIC